MAGLWDVRWHLELIKYRVLTFLLPTTVDDAILKHAKPICNAGSIVLVVFSAWKFLLPDTHLLVFLLFNCRITVTLLRGLLVTQPKVAS